MALLIFFVVLSVGVSFLCSMLEAIILSVTPSYLTSLKNKNPKLFKEVEILKSDIEKPLASILTFNTIAHTVGAAGAGAEAQRIFGSEILAVFSAILTFIILFFSEIIPKSIGASSWKFFLPMAAKILKPMILISTPIVWLSNLISKLFKSKNNKITREEIMAMAEIGLNDGILAKDEHRTLLEVIKFRKLTAKDILTPKALVKGVDLIDDLQSVYEKIQEHNFSRLIVFGINSDDIKGYVLRTRVLHAYIDKTQESVQDLSSPILILQDTTPLTQLFKRLMERREHISAVVNEDGEFVGVVTMEDIIERLIGFDIFDELDD